MNKKPQIIIVLSEIYGNNEFIKEVCLKLEKENFDTYCPNLIHHAPFSYQEMDNAYHHFINMVGFDEYTKMIELIDSLKEEYEHVYLLGFSIGATIAWRCAMHSPCDGIIACYGSRIREYLDVTPAIDTLLITAKEEGFDVAQVNDQLKIKNYVSIHSFNTSHGFMDSFSSHYDHVSAQAAWADIMNFLRKK